MTWIWAGMMVLSLVFGICSGRMDAVSRAALQGAENAVHLGLTMAGSMALWSGIVELMRRCGLMDALAYLFRPLLQKLLPRASADRGTLSAVSANVCANLLGLGNAATPPGIQAAEKMAVGCHGTADDELCRLVVLNTASIQLLPTTVAGIRAACGAASPMDILPAVWLTSLASVTAGLAAARLMQGIWRN